MKIRNNPTCPLEIAHDMIRGKWKTIIIFQLRNGVQSLASLKKSINKITEKVLIEQLDELIDYGFISKKSYQGYPRKVEYSLTSRGKKLLEIVYQLQDLGKEYLNEKITKK